MRLKRCPTLLEPLLVFPSLPSWSRRRACLTTTSASFVPWFNPVLSRCGVDQCGRTVIAIRTGTSSRPRKDHTFMGAADLQSLSGCILRFPSAAPKQDRPSRKCRAQSQTVHRRKNARDRRALLFRFCLRQHECQQSERRQPGAEFEHRNDADVVGERPDRRGCESAEPERQAIE